MTFADALRALRSRLKITQEQAVERIPGLSVRTFQAWEAGRQTPPLWAQGLVLVAIFDQSTGTDQAAILGKIERWGKTKP